MASKISVLLPTGQLMPALGFGTWQANDNELEAAVDNALEAGYRHIDTAPVYENEHIIGKVLKKWLDSGRVNRSELFIVTKVRSDYFKWLPPTGNHPAGVEKWIKRSLSNLQLEYLDLYLIHTPFTFEEVGEELHPFNEKGEIRINPTTDHLKVWAEMEQQVVEGRTKAIGLSNFNIEQIRRILATTKLPIANLQIELHVYFQQEELVNFCKSNNIAVTAYSPLGSRGLVKILGKAEDLPDLLVNPIVLRVAKKHNKTPAQVLLRHIIEKGIATIPKSTNLQRINENIQLYNWKLLNEDVDDLNALNLGKSARICDFSFFKGIENHPEFPF